MRETCDRCGVSVAASHEARTAERRLTFCTHHTNRYQSVLEEQGWQVAPLDRELATV